MPLPTIPSGNVASQIPTGYNIDNSCRFNDGDSAQLTRTLGTPTDADKWTLSVWIKRGVLGTAMAIADAASDGNNYTEIYFGSDDKLYWEEKHSNSYVMRLITNRVFRDSSAWYHIVFTYDSGNATSGNRMRIYVNGTEETSFGTDSAPSQDLDSKFNSAIAHAIGSITPEGGTMYFDGYMAEVVLSDGQAYAASDFGEFDEDSPTIWKPKDVSGLTFGTNGFYLDFEASDNLGNDANGGTDWSESNLAATDQTTDTPTNNFATMNPLDNYYSAATFSEGNCYLVTGGTGYAHKTSTIAVSAGKWYMEAKAISTASGTVILKLGIADSVAIDTNAQLGYASNAYGYNSNNGNILTGNSSSSYGNTFTANDIIGIALNLDDNELKFYKNGTVQNSGTAVSITAVASTANGHYFFACGDESNNTFTVALNFGNPPYANTSDAADENGYGKFEYAPPSGFLALCTKNLGSDGG